MQSGNPALNKNTFLDVANGALVAHGDDAMTINGTVNKTGLMLILVLVGAMYSWAQFTGPASAPAMMPLVLGGAIGGLVLALVTAFKKTWAPFTAPLYALVEGVFIGALSAIFEARYPGIVIQAVGLTFGTMAAMLLAYRSGLIRATEKFKLGVVAATGGILLLYLAQFVMGFFGHSMDFISGNGFMAIGFSAFVVGHCGVEPGAGLRPDRIRCAIGCAKVHGVVRRVCADRDAGVAVSGNLAPAVEGAVPQLAGARPGRSLAPRSSTRFAPFRGSPRPHHLPEWWQLTRTSLSRRARSHRATQATWQRLAV